MNTDTVVQEDTASRMAEDTSLSQAQALEIQYSGNKGKILDLLGQGMNAELVASVVGCTPSWVSQLMSEKEFATAVVARRFQLHQQNDTRDRRLDQLEDAFIKKIEDLLPMMYKPAEIFRGFQLVNAAKRRGYGATAEGSTMITNTVVQLVLPPQIVSQFTKDLNNQVVELQNAPQTHSLVTLQSANLRLLAEKRKGAEDVRTSTAEVGTGQAT